MLLGFPPMDWRLRPISSGLNLLGMNAIHGYNGRAAVSVSKHGLWGLTKALAKRFCD